MRHSGGKQTRTTTESRQDVGHGDHPECTLRAGGGEMAATLDEDMHICRDSVEVHRWRGNSVQGLNLRARSGWGAALRRSRIVEMA